MEYNFRINYLPVFLNDLKKVDNNENNLLSINYFRQFSNVENDIDIIIDKLIKFNKIKLTLDLSCLDLKFIPKNIFKLKNLIGLNLNCNKLKSIPPDISKLINLETLNIGLNYDMDLVFPKDICKLKKLNFLFYGTWSHNDHKIKIPFQVLNLKNIKTFNIGFNKSPIIYDLQKLERTGIYVCDDNFEIIKHKRFIYRLTFVIYKSKKILNYKIIKI
jgi:Leucine-rich repeat (LRR) protein